MENLQQVRFIKLQDVSDITTLGKSTILAWEAQGKFPKAVRLSKTLRVWLHKDVEKWIIECADVNHV